MRSKKKKKKNKHEGFWWGVGDVLFELITIPFRVLGYIFIGIIEFFSGW